MTCRPFTKRGLILLALLGSTGGCASVPPTTLIALPSVPSPVFRAIDASTPVVMLARVVIPEYLASKRVRYKVDEITVAEWPNTFWAERIEVAITRTFNLQLQQFLGSWRVCEADCGPSQPATMLQVTLLEIDYLRGERRLIARARVQVNPGVVGAPFGQERTYEVIAAGDSAYAQAAATSELLRNVAKDAAVLIAPLATSSVIVKNRINATESNNANYR